MADVPALSWRGQARGTVHLDAGRVRVMPWTQPSSVFASVLILFLGHISPHPNPFPRSEATAAQFMHQDGES